MYCSHCGKKITSDDLYCRYCGTKVSIDNKESKKEVVEPKIEEEPKENNSLKTASIVLGIVALVGNALIVFSFASIVLAIIGLILAICANKKVSNVAGIVLNSVSVVLSILLISFIMRFIKFIPKLINQGLDLGNNIVEKYNQNNDYDLGDFFENFYNGDFNIEDFFNGFNYDKYNLPDDYNEIQPKERFQ